MSNLPVRLICCHWSSNRGTPKNVLRNPRVPQKRVWSPPGLMITPHSPTSCFQHQPATYCTSVSPWARFGDKKVLLQLLDDKLPFNCSPLMKENTHTHYFLLFTLTLYESSHVNVSKCAFWIEILILAELENQAAGMFVNLTQGNTRTDGAGVGGGRTIQNS